LFLLFLSIFKMKLISQSAWQMQMMQLQRIITSLALAPLICRGGQAKVFFVKSANSKFFDSFRCRKSVNFLGVPVCKSQTRNVHD
jgi:hypothetical protein